MKFALILYEALKLLITIILLKIFVTQTILTLAVFLRIFQQSPSLRANSIGYRTPSQCFNCSNKCPSAISQKALL